MANVPPIGQASSATPALIGFQNAVYLAFTATSEPYEVLLVSTQDGQTWSPPIPTNQNAFPFTSPALAVLNDVLWVAFTAANTSQYILLMSSADGSTWSGNYNSGFNASGSGAALVSYNGELWMAFNYGSSYTDDPTDSAPCYGPFLASSANGQDWSRYGSAEPGILPGTAPSMTVFGDAIWLAFVSQGNINVCSYSTAQGWSPVVDTNLSALTGATPALVATASGLALAFIEAGSSGNIAWSTSPDGVSWSTPQTTGQSSTMAPALLWLPGSA